MNNTGTSSRPAMSRSSTATPIYQRRSATSTSDDAASRDSAMRITGMPTNGARLVDSDGYGRGGERTGPPCTRWLQRNQPPNSTHIHLTNWFTLLGGRHRSCQRGYHKANVGFFRSHLDSLVTILHPRCERGNSVLHPSSDTMGSKGPDDVSASIRSYRQSLFPNGYLSQSTTFSVSPTISHNDGPFHLRNKQHHAISPSPSKSVSPRHKDGNRDVEDVSYIARTVR